MKDLADRRCAILGFEGGQLTIRQSGHGERDGTGFFQFEEEDINWHQHDDSGKQYLRIEVERSELIELHDYLGNILKKQGGSNV